MLLSELKITFCPNADRLRPPPKKLRGGNKNRMLFPFSTKRIRFAFTNRRAGFLCVCWLCTTFYELSPSILLNLWNIKMDTRGCFAGVAWEKVGCPNRTRSVRRFAFASGPAGAVSFNPETSETSCSARVSVVLLFWPEGDTGGSYVEGVCAVGRSMWVELVSGFKRDFITFALMLHLKGYPIQVLSCSDRCFMFF